MFEINDKTTTPTDEPAHSGGLKKLAIAFTIILLIAVAVRIYLVVKTRHDEQTAKVDDGPSHHLVQDDYIVPRKIYPSTIADVKALNGKRIWVFAGGQMQLYPATPARLDYAHPAGLLLGAEPLDVVNFIEQAAPKKLWSRIPSGDRQVIMLFHRPTDAGKLFGTPVGYRENGQYTFYLDEAYFYDDPHVLYKHWPANIWQAVDAHKAVPGMNELQAQLALGQVSKPGSGTPNNRTVEYDNNGHPVTITFEHGKATKVE